MPEPTPQPPPGPTAAPSPAPRAAPSAPGRPHVLTLNGGSSSIKFAAFVPGGDAQAPPTRVLAGQIERIGQPGTLLTATGAGERGDERAGERAGGNRPGEGPATRLPIEASDHAQAAGQLIDFLLHRLGSSSLVGVGHRVVHGGLHLVEHQLVTDELVAELKRNQPLDLAHLPREIALVEAVRARFPGLPQVACFDTAFHRDLPRVAQLLPIPRRYADAGVRRFGFHGLSYSYLMGELRRLTRGSAGDGAGGSAADGRVVLAHLGSGASMAAVRGGKPLDTTMAFTPLAGLVMGTRPGDLDPGLLVYLMRAEQLSPEQMDEFLSRRCGMLGVSETTPDLRDLLARRDTDARAAEAVELFCYQAKKWVGALAAAMGGLETLVFSGGIGEHSPEARAGIARGLEFLGLEWDEERNRRNEAVVSTDASRVTARVIATDEELMIARAAWAIIGERPE